MRRTRLSLLDRAVLALTSAAAGAFATAQAAGATAAGHATGDLQACAVIDAAEARLACYDRVVGRATAPGRGAAPSPDAAPSAAPLAGETQPRALALRPWLPAPRLSMSRYWELGREDKRGTFNFVGYRPNFLLPVHLTDAINRAPQSPVHAAVNLPDYRHVEAKIQLSMRAKLAQSLILPDADLWFGYTQQSLWQLWNPPASAPFRNTDYEPELIYVVPVPETMGRMPWGWQWRFGQVALAHQSNGQAKPLSRSWNRVYLGAGMDNGDWSLVARVLRRLPERAGDDDNPDITDYRGRSDLQLIWTPGDVTVSALYRSTFKDRRRGAFQLDWTYPVDRRHPSGLRWYVQTFSGYGETLTDYNFRQSSIGLGVTLFGF